MNDREHLRSLQPSQKSQSLPSSEAWFVILMFVFVTLILLSAGSIGAKILSVVFPLGSFVVGWFLYFRYPVIYLGFVWWLFFLVAFVRRVADFRAGAFSESSPILLAPYMAVLVCGYTLFINLPKIRQQGTLPFILAFASIFYGFLVGLINSVGVINGKPIGVAVRLLEWLCPLLLGYHLYVNWRRYPEYSRNLKNVFLWGVLVMGTYGIYQYLVAPEWDRLWLISSGMLSSSGKPEPLGIRVWSTLNSPGPFGDYMATGLAILLSCHGSFVAPSAAVGFLSFLLSVVRTAWIGWFLGMVSLITFLPTKQKTRLALTIILLAIIVIPLSMIEPFATTISTRMGTLGDLSNDGSTLERKAAFSLLINDALSQVIGTGIGTFDTDSAFLVLMFELGWIGTIPYIGSLIAIIIKVFSFDVKSDDIFLPITRAVLIKSIFFLGAGPTMRGSQGVILWGFLGIALAGREYYQALENKA
jgi:hypothetical protein